MDTETATPEAPPSVRAAFEPVTIALRTLSLLGEADAWPGLNPWLRHMSDAATPDDLRANRLVFGPLRGALHVASLTNSFPVYLAALAAVDPYALRDRALQALRTRLARTVAPSAAHLVPSAERLLSDRDTFLAAAEHDARTTPFALPADAETLRQAYTLLGDPARLRGTLIEHLTALWERTFAVEWRRVERILGWQAQMYDRALQDIGTAIPLATIFRELTGRELDASVADALSGADEVVLVPCWHLGRWALPWDIGDDKPRLCFGEPPVDIALLRGTPVSRGELRARLATLADDTRLRIVAMVGARDEMSAQEIVAALELSQSNVSRHLKLLVQLGYLYERRGEGASKSYRVSAYHLDRTATALRHLADGEFSAPEAPVAAVSPELRRFVDRTGRLASWPPAHQRDKLLVLEYLAAAFEPGHVYTEREVGDVLDQRSSVPDHAALRRALYEFRFMNRARDGSRYWLSGTLPESE